MMILRSAMAFALATSVAAGSAWAAPARSEGDAPTSAGAAIGYCMAVHPYRPLATGATPDGYTLEGFEISQSLLVGAVRRSFIHDRAVTPDRGNAATCAQACGELAKSSTNVVGKPLHHKRSGKIETNGVADIGTRVLFDQAPSGTEARAVAGGSGRVSDSYLEANVAPSDYCCCQLVPGRTQ